MGNEKSKLPDGKGTSTPRDASMSKSRDQRLVAAYNRIRGPTHENLTMAALRKFYGDDMSKSLYNYLGDEKSQDVGITLDEFLKRAPPLQGSSTDVYVKAFLPVPHLLKVCSESAGARAVQGDEPFIAALINAMGSSLNEVVTWKHAECPKFCNALQWKVLFEFFGTSHDPLSKPVDYSSDILSPLQMWYLQCALPQLYFPHKETPSSSKVTAEEELRGHWTPLYSSAVHGISVNRFETNVFDYRGPTVSIFKLTDGRVVVIATEQEWRHSSKRFGGAATVYYELSPSLRKVEASSSIYCNLKLRSASLGLSFTEVLKIDKDMSCVNAIEVWGCAGANTLEEQQKLKKWQSGQAEKNRKVPLPGNWDENPDKTLLEMAGFQFSRERELMEREGQS